MVGVGAALVLFAAGCGGSDADGSASEQSALHDGNPGAQGPAGANGTNGAAGAAGAAGPAGPTLLKRVTFANVGVSLLGVQADTMASIAFTPPTSGIAVLGGRGRCNVVALASSDNEIDLAAGSDNATAFTLDKVHTIADWGIVSVPQSSVTGEHYDEAWSSETTMPVVAGKSYKVVLAAKHGLGPLDGTSDCSGSFEVQIYSGALP